MDRPTQQARIITGALAVGFCLATGCVHTGQVTCQPAATIAPINEEQRVEALTSYATGYSRELTRGLDEAMPFYRRALELNPRNLALAIRLAQIHLTRKEFVSAGQLLHQTSQANPSAPEPWFWLAVVDKTNEKTTEAIADLEQALKLAPTYLEAVQLLLEIRLQQGNDPAVADLLNRAWLQKSTDPHYWIRIGELYNLTLRQKPSLRRLLSESRIQQSLEKAGALAPNNTEILIRLGDFYAAGDHPEQAVALYEKLFAQRPALPKIREKLAIAYIRAEQPEKALPLLEEVIKREPLRVEIYNLLGDVFDELGRNERAISSYQQSLVVNPNQLAPQLHIFVLQMKLKRFDDARATLDAAAKSYPTAPVIPFYYGIYHTEQKEYAKAVIHFADAESLALDASDNTLLDSTFYFHYGAACERTGDTAKAVQLLRKALALNPENHQALNWLGYLWADKGENLDEARQFIEKAVKLDPDNGAYLDSLGWVLFKQGRTNEALPHLLRAVELEKGDATVVDHLAAALTALGKPDEAQALKEKFGKPADK
jgi:tetratricopeptide (TPR) repeat protein